MNFSRRQPIYFYEMKHRYFGFRATETDAVKLQSLCAKKSLKPSELLRQLINEKYDQQAEENRIDHLQRHTLEPMQEDIAKILSLLHKPTRGNGGKAAEHQGRNGMNWEEAVAKVKTSEKYENGFEGEHDSPPPDCKPTRYPWKSRGQYEAWLTMLTKAADVAVILNLESAFPKRGLDVYSGRPLASETGGK